MFTYDCSYVLNGQMVGVYTVRYFATNGQADYVTVNTELPGTSYAGDYYDKATNGVLWVALAEKAYAEVNGEGTLATGSPYKNSYAALNGGWGSWSQEAITGRAAANYNITPSNVACALQAGYLVGLGSLPDGTTEPCPYIVNGHEYAVLAYNPSSSTPFLVYNPWGTDANGWVPGLEGQTLGLFWANGASLAANYSVESFGVGAATIAPAMLPQTTTTVTGISKVIEPTATGNPALSPVTTIQTTATPSTASGTDSQEFSPVTTGHQQATSQAHATSVLDQVFADSDLASVWAKADLLV